MFVDLFQEGGVAKIVGVNRIHVGDTVQSRANLLRPTPVIGVDHVGHTVTVPWGTNFRTLPIGTILEVVNCPHPKR